MAKLIDECQRLRAVSDHASTLLVEAGAGTGKTCLLAGRVALLLAGGAEPRQIAAITFTELAASELLSRISEYVYQLRDRRGIPAVLQPALPNGLTVEQWGQLARAVYHLDELTCTTIHGFCQRLITPYPVEAQLDPGAAMMDESEQDLAHGLLVDKWLRAQLGDCGSISPLARLLLDDTGAALKFIYQLAEARRARRHAGAAPCSLSQPHIDAFREAVGSFRAWYDGIARRGLQESDTAQWIEDFERLARFYEPGYSADAPFSSLWTYARPEHISAMKKDTYELRKYQFVGKWQAAAKRVGQSGPQARQYFDQANALYERVGASLSTLLDTLAEGVLSRIVSALDGLQEEYRALKQQSALLDFDDLLYHARELLRTQPQVREALADRFRYVLVDEFQDTDPVQCDILFLLCGDGDGNAPWEGRRVRPGQLFLVGDPKQSIYRFRQADIDCYKRVRAIIEAQFPSNKLEITANFRSQKPVLDYVNECFANPLSSIGFAPLSCTVGGPLPTEPRVACIEVGEPDLHGADDRRRLEADALAELCDNLIGRFKVRTRQGGMAPCSPGHIALLSPSSTGLWMYERALEQKGIPIATQAGKGLFRRQEIHDLVAITRVLSSSRDTLALGGLLRGPLVGLTEQELLDIVEQLPPPDAQPGELGRLRLWTDPSLVKHDLAAATLATLQSLAKRAYSTSPFDLLSAAIEELRVRPLLVQRHPRYAERALANVDLFLQMARPYSVRGLRAFAREMSRRWAEEERQVEGRCDSGDEAVQVITVHSAKGLEWPVVVAINMNTETARVSGVLYRPEDQTLHCKFGPFVPASYTRLREREAEQFSEERKRLWYVLCTRARDLLLIPRHVYVSDRSWFQEVDLHLWDLPALQLLSGAVERVEKQTVTNSQTAARFSWEAERIVHRTTTIKWSSPSRQEIGEGETLPFEPRSDETVGDLAPRIQGGAVRGITLHRLIEEILNDETPDDMPAVQERAAELLLQMGVENRQDPAVGPCAREIAAAVMRALQLPLVARYRSRLLAEFNVYDCVEIGENSFEAAAGFADAVAFGDSGAAEFVIDWKSDVNPDSAAQQHYAGQMHEYLSFLGCPRGAIVYLTSGVVQEITAPSLAARQILE